jgi:hypothetical protein
VTERDGQAEVRGTLCDPGAAAVLGAPTRLRRPLSYRAGMRDWLPEAVLIALVIGGSLAVVLVLAATRWGVF